MPQIGQNIYSQSGGITPLPELVQEPRNPTNLDVIYPLYQKWINTTTDIIFILVAFDSSSGTVLAIWQQESGDINTITGNTGGAVPPNNEGNINVLGASGQVVVTGSPSINTLTISLSGAGTAIGSVAVDANTSPGTNPVVATSGGLITVTGAQVAPSGVGANVIRTDSLAASTMTIEIQQTATAASKDTTKNGVAHFNNAQFTNDQGFISILGRSVNYTNVTHSLSPYTVLSTDYYISVDCSAGVVTLNFPNSPTANQEWIVKDRTGNCASNNITITTTGGTLTFDGGTSIVMDSNYMALNILANATPTYEVF
jgi:hypothetical protein